MGALAPQDEQAFQAFMAFDPNVRQWRNGFQNQYGEQPNMSDPSFNYRTAFMAGNKPQMYPVDGTMHWDSRGKSPDHPTEWMNTFMQRFGVDPNVAAQGIMPPAQSQMVNQQLTSDMLRQRVRGLL